MPARMRTRILFLFVFHNVLIAAQEDVVLVRTEPSDQSPCPGQMVEYECHSEIPVGTLVWTLPTGESLTDFTGGSMNGTTRTASDGVYVATLTSLVPDDDPNSDFFFFTSTLLIMETVNNSNITCAVAIGNDVMKQNAVIILSDAPDPPTDGLYMYDGGLTVDLEWNRPSYTGGDGVTVDEYTVNGESVPVSDSSVVVSYTSTGLIYGEVLVTAINSCGLESLPTSINIPASGPPDIDDFSEPEFSCNASLKQFPVKISWIPGARSEGVVYPGEVRVNVELLSDSDSIACSVDTDTSCTAIITRDDYTVTVNQTNDIDSTLNTHDFDANIVDVTERMLGDNDDPLSVTVTVNGLCPSDRDYLVLVSYGTRPLTGSDSDCEGQVNTTVMTISSGDSATFSVPADTVSRRNDEEYCYTVIVDGEVVDGGDPDDVVDEALKIGLSVGAGVVVVSGSGGVVVVVVVIVWRRGKKKKEEKKDKEEREDVDTSKEVDSMQTCIVCICCKKKTHDGQEMNVLSSSGAASPVTKDPSSAETGEAGPMYQDPNTISRSPHPSTGEVYTDVRLDKKKKAPIEHEVAPGGEVYAMPQKKGKKGKKKKKEGEEEEELTDEEKAALYSVPDKKGQKAKSQGLNYADIDLQSSTKPAPPSQGSQYVEVKHN